MNVLLFHVKGMEAKHMTWLKKSEPAEAWEIEDEEKIGDIELARQIREICNSVADSAEAVSVLYYGPSTETKKRQIDRYERAKKRAEKTIEQISDQLPRDTALCQVLNFCMKASDVENAERLFHQVQTAWVTERVKSEHPMFRDFWGAEGNGTQTRRAAVADKQPQLARVRMSVLGAARRPNLAAREGVIVGEGQYRSTVRVVFDGFKRPSDALNSK